MKRPFWLHQIVDYILGILLMSQAPEAPKPLVPLIVGFLVLANGASVDGPLAAFRGLSRPHHRIADFVLLVVVLAVGVTGYGVTSGGRTTFIAGGVLWAIVILSTNFAPKVKRVKVAPEMRATEAGKSAGRMVAGGINSWRRMRDSR